MSALDSRGTDIFDDDADTAHDLIILRADRIVFHDHYASRHERLLAAHHLVTTCEKLSGDLGGHTLAEIDRLTIPHPAGSGDDHRADQLIDQLAKLCRAGGVHLYITTTHRPQATVNPAELFTVVTDYGFDNVVTEHFTDRDARRRSLIERAEQFSTSREIIPDLTLVDDRQLTGMISSRLAPAAIHLTESTFNESTGTYAPAGAMLPIR